MANVYGQVHEFYKDHSDAAHILPKDIVERYLRRKAWQGADDRELKGKWGILSVMLLYAMEIKVYDLSYLTLYDYQEIVYRVAENRKMVLLDEAHVCSLLDSIDDFYGYLKQIDFSDVREFLQEVRESFYEDGSFAMPERCQTGEFYRNLEHMEEVSQEDLDMLNDILDKLLRDISEYFHQPQFLMDLTRAVSLFGGPDYEHPDDEASQDVFWFRFWDYFLFDYHLLQTDDTPLRYFYVQQKECLESAEVDIIRDLLRARFTVFYIEGMDEDYITCRDLFTEELIELPAMDAFLPDYRRVVLYGHIHARGVMLLDYITIVPASDRLRRRMKEEILRQFELFRYQEPEATRERFFFREAAAIRHTIQILSDFTQLKVVPVKSYPAPITRAEGLQERYAVAENRLKDAALKLGFSIHGIQLIVRFYEDFLTQSAISDTLKRRASTLTAVLMVFSRINGLDILGVRGGMDVLGADRSDVFRMVPEVEKATECIAFDPRYLTEEGFVQALFFS